MYLLQSTTLAVQAVAIGPYKEKLKKYIQIGSVGPLPSIKKYNWDAMFKAKRAFIIYVKILWSLFKLQVHATHKNSTHAILHKKNLWFQAWILK